MRSGGGNLVEILSGALSGKHAVEARPSPFPATPRSLKNSPPGNFWSGVLFSFMKPKCLIRAISVASTATVLVSGNILGFAVILASHDNLKLYDWLLIFPEEVEYIWCASWKWSKVLYLLTRYIPFASMGFMLLSESLPYRLARLPAHFHYPPYWIKFTSRARLDIAYPQGAV